MTEKKLTGNKMFEMVKEECEKYFEKLKKRKGVLFFINRNRKLGWYEDGDEKKDGKYVGEIENRKPSEIPTHPPLLHSSEFPTLAIYPNSGIHTTSEEKSQLT